METFSSSAAFSKDTILVLAMVSSRWSISTSSSADVTPILEPRFFLLPGAGAGRDEKEETGVGEELAGTREDAGRT